MLCSWNLHINKSPLNWKKNVNHMFRKYCATHDLWPVTYDRNTGLLSKIVECKKKSAFFCLLFLQCYLPFPLVLSLAFFLLERVFMFILTLNGVKWVKDHREQFRCYDFLWQPKIIIEMYNLREKRSLVSWTDCNPRLNFSKMLILFEYPLEIILRNGNLPRSRLSL